MLFYDEGYLILSDLRILEHLVNRVNGRFEHGSIDLLELRTADCRGEVVRCVQRIDLDGRLRYGTERPLCALTRTPQTTKRTWVVTDIMLGLALEFVLEVLKKVVVEVLTTKMSVTCGCLDGEDTSSDVEQGDIEGSSTEIENEDKALSLGLIVKTVCNGSRCGFIDDTEDVESSNLTRIFGSETLGVVEVCRNAGSDFIRSSSQVLYGLPLT